MLNFEHTTQLIPRRDLAHELERMSAEGWEMVCALDRSSGFVGADAGDRLVELFWKRPNGNVTLPLTRPK